ncbi:MAG: ubiquinol-cytochrome c reductase iron-sulfur subunit [Pyrinomonadaceae bacterium]|jgi:cytochrome b6-f complex iron-sulfur subunit
MKSKKSGLEGDEHAPPARRAISPDENMKQGSEGSKSGWTRRKILSRLGVGATLMALGGQAYAFVRSLVPNVLYESPQRYKVGTPDQFNEGPSFLEDKRVFIFRQKNTFHAISAACTHLGCTVKMQRLNQPKKVTVRGRDIEEQAEFACPCHGSKYYGDGTNYSGPAPRPLDHYKLELSPDDGQLVVDASQIVAQDFRLTV